MKHLKYLEGDLELYYLEEWVQKVDLVIILLERQSAVVIEGSDCSNQ